MTTDRYVRIVPRFSLSEGEDIDNMVKSGICRSRADLVRKATIIFIEQESTKNDRKV